MIFYEHRILETNLTNFSQTALGAKQVLVTIIVTHYDYSNFVENALRSVVAQSHTHFECVVVDDHSAPHHVQKLRQVIAGLADSRFKLVELPENKGQTNAVFEGLKHSAGEFVSLLDPDDLYETQFLEKMLKCHLNPCVYAPVAACEMGVFRVGGAILSKAYVGFKRDAVVAGELPKYEASLYDFGFSKYYPPEITEWIWATTSSLMFRRDALEILRREAYMPSINICADTYCVFGAHLMGGTLFIDEVLSWRGIHSANAVESDKHFSSYQKRHQLEFLDTTLTIKLFVMKTILENDCLMHLKPDRLLSTLVSHFSVNQLEGLLADKPALATKLLAHAWTLERPAPPAPTVTKPTL